jgi:hypothetical protein
MSALRTAVLRELPGERLVAELDPDGTLNIMWLGPDPDDDKILRYPERWDMTRGAARRLRDFLVAELDTDYVTAPRARDR